MYPPITNIYIYTPNTSNIYKIYICLYISTKYISIYISTKYIFIYKIYIFIYFYFFWFIGIYGEMYNVYICF